MKILAVCQSGLGSSFYGSNEHSGGFKAENVDTSDGSSWSLDVGSATADSADYFCWINLLMQ